MRVLLTSAAGLLLYEALLSLLLLSGVAVGLLTLQGRSLASSQDGQAHAVVMAESWALVQGMRVNALYDGERPHWRHYQALAERLGQASDCGGLVRATLSAEALAQRQLCRLALGVGQVVAADDFAYVVCARVPPLAANTLPATGPLSLRCGTGSGAWGLLLAWRVGQQVYVHALRLSHV